MVTRDGPPLRRTLGLRMTAAVLMLLATVSVVFPFACILRYTLLGYYDPGLWPEYLKYEAVLLPLAILLGTTSYGLWYQKWWARTIGLGFGWLAAVGGTMGVLFGLVVTASSSGWGRGIAFAATATVFAFTVPAWLLVLRLRTLR